MSMDEHPLVTAATERVRLLEQNQSEAIAAVVAARRALEKAKGDVTRGLLSGKKASLSIREKSALEVAEDNLKLIEESLESARAGLAKAQVDARRELFDRAFEDYKKAIRDFWNALVVAAERNEALMEAFNRCAQFAGEDRSTSPVHWQDISANPLSNSRLVAWARAVDHALGTSLLN